MLLSQPVLVSSVDSPAAVCSCPGGPLLTPPQHVFPLQQLDDGGLRGRDQDDAAVLSPTHQPALRGDVNAGRHLGQRDRCGAEGQVRDRGTGVSQEDSSKQSLLEGWKHPAEALEADLREALLNGSGSERQPSARTRTRTST